MAGFCECGNDPSGSIKCGAENVLTSQEGPLISCTSQLYYPTEPV